MTIFEKAAKVVQVLGKMIRKNVESKIASFKINQSNVSRPAGECHVTARAMSRHSESDATYRFENSMAFQRSSKYLQENQQGFAVFVNQSGKLPTSVDSCHRRSEFQDLRFSCCTSWQTQMSTSPRMRAYRSCLVRRIVTSCRISNKKRKAADIEESAGLLEAAV